MSNAMVEVPRAPKLRMVQINDIGEALRRGVADFLAAPLFGLFFGGVFAAGGLAIFWFLSMADMGWMIIPIGIGFPLVGPFVAAGLYEVSCRRAAGLKLSWKAVLLTVFRQRERQMGWMAFVVLFILWVWLYQVRLLLALFMGFSAPSSLLKFLEVVLTTPSGSDFSPSVRQSGWCWRRCCLQLRCSPCRCCSIRSSISSPRC